MAKYNKFFELKNSSEIYFKDGLTWHESCYN